MTLIIILLVLLLLFSGSGFYFHRSPVAGPAWAPNLLWILAVVVLIALVLNLLGVWTYPVGLR